MKTISPPTPEEYAEFYAGYIEFASKRSDVIAAFPEQIDEMRAALGGLTDQQALFRDAPQEWSIKEALGHMIDTERIFSYRMLCISRNDVTPLPGFEQDDYVREAEFDSMPFVDLLDEFEHLRRANILAIRNMRDEMAGRTGTASGFPVSARALIYMLVGHVDHHMASLHEKYLPALK